MRFLRPLLLFLAVTGGLSALLVGLAFVPPVQTWFVQRALARHPEFPISVGSVSATWSHVHLTNLRIQGDAAVLTIPALDATLPVFAAWRERRAQLQAVTAQGWTLDLCGPPVLSTSTTPARTATEAATPVAPTAMAFRGLLARLALPCDLSLDQATLSGEVLLPPLAGSNPTRWRVKLTGGGLAPDHAGTFAVEVAPSAPSSAPAPAPVLRGHLTVALGSPRTVQRLALEGQLTLADGPRPDRLALSTQITLGPSASSENYAFTLRRDERPLVTVGADLAFAPPRVTGTWKIDLPSDDLARLAPSLAASAPAASGEGRFDADVAFTRVQATGHLRATLPHLGMFSPALARVGAVILDSDFAASRTSRSLHVEQLAVALAGSTPLLTARALQPFDYDLRTHALTVSDHTADWLDGTLHALPLDWLSGLISDTTFAGGNLSGAFRVATTGDRFALRATAPLTATGVSLLHAGQPLAQGLDLSLALLATHTTEGWQLQSKPLLLTSSGRRLATVEATVAPLAEPRMRYSVTGTVDADLDALAAQPALARFGGTLGRAASGDFVIRVGPTTEVRTNLKFLGHTPDRIVTTTARTYFDAYGGVVFKLPLAFVFGSAKSNFTFDGQWAQSKTGRRLDLDFGGLDVDLDHLHRLAATFSYWSGVPLPSLDAAPGRSPTPTTVSRDTKPFWGDWIGRAKFDFYRLRSATQELNEVGGILRLEPGSLRLEKGHAVLAQARVAPQRDAFGQFKAEPPRNRLTAEGTLSFDAAAAAPYSLSASVGVDVVDSARLFTPAQAAHDPVIEGRFALTSTIFGQGLTLPHLVDQRREEFRLTGKKGVVRLLKSTVAADIPDDPTPVKDTFAKVGSMVGTLLGIRKDAIDTGLAKMSKATRAVLDLNYQIQEFHYDDFTLTATRGADRTFTVSSLALTTPLLRFTGTGSLGGDASLPLRARPLALELKIGAKAHLAGFLTTAGLLGTDTDEQGFTFLPQPVHFGGTLERLDNTAWHDLLVKAATPPSADKKSAR